MALVIKKWFADVSPREDGSYVDILARESGLIAWFLALIRIDPTYSLKIQYDKIFYESRSLFGYKKIALPVASVSSVFFGYSRPWKLALFWFLLFAAVAYLLTQFDQTIWSFVLFLVGILVGVLVFIFNRELTLGVKEQDGEIYDLQCTRSFIENQEINEESLERITLIFIAIVDAHKAAKG